MRAAGSVAHSGALDSEQFRDALQRQVAALLLAGSVVAVRLSPARALQPLLAPFAVAPNSLSAEAQQVADWAALPDEDAR